MKYKNTEYVYGVHNFVIRFVFWTQSNKRNWQRWEKCQVYYVLRGSHWLRGAIAIEDCREMIEPFQGDLEETSRNKRHDLREESFSSPWGVLKVS